MLAVNICVVSLVGDSPPCEFLSILKKVLKIGIAFICVRNSFLFLHLCPLISTVEFSQELRIENYPSYSRCTKFQPKKCSSKSRRCVKPETFQIACWCYSFCCDRYCFQNSSIGKRIEWEIKLFKS